MSEEAGPGDLVASFIDIAFNQHRPEHAAEYLADDYIQHNPGAADGRAGFVATVRELIAAYPRQRMDVLAVEYDGALVGANCRWFRAVGEPGTELVDFFRVESGLLVEHWDVIDERCGVPGDREAEDAVISEHLRGKLGSVLAHRIDELRIDPGSAPVAGSLRYTARRIVGRSGTVFVHAELETATGSTRWARVDLLEVVGDKALSARSVQQLIPVTAAHANSMV